MAVGAPRDAIEGGGDTREVGCSRPSSMSRLLRRGGLEVETAGPRRREARGGGGGKAAVLGLVLAGVDEEVRRGSLPYQPDPTERRGIQRCCLPCFDGGCRRDRGSSVSSCIGGFVSDLAKGRLAVAETAMRGSATATASRFLISSPRSLPSAGWVVSLFFPFPPLIDVFCGGVVCHRLRGFVRYHVHRTDRIYHG
uniref:Uncharacterized protein n=1 Tax=Arundo donax TaxID=35708 RepID=A0A0A8XR86_ARUDO